MNPFTPAAGWPGYASTARRTSHQPASKASPITVVGYVASAPPPSLACTGHPLLLVTARQYLCIHTAGWFVHACTYDTTTGTIVKFVEDSHHACRYAIYMVLYLSYVHLAQPYSSRIVERVFVQDYFGSRVI
jgi:hypothetical protein